jgi:flagellar protein FlaF
MSYAAYARTQNTTENPRNVEYKLLGQVTAALMRAEETPNDMHQLMDAVLWNQSVWNAFLADLSHEGNRLPVGLKKDLVSLALWVIRETDRVMDRRTGVDGLINVNKTVMQGLR